MGLQSFPYELTLEVELGRFILFGTGPAIEYSLFSAQEVQFKEVGNDAPHIDKQGHSWVIYMGLNPPLRSYRLRWNYAGSNTRCFSTD